VAVLDSAYLGDTTHRIASICYYFTRGKYEFKSATNADAKGFLRQNLANLKTPLVAKKKKKKKLL
jgi:hypothetical protein